MEPPHAGSILNNQWITEEIEEEIRKYLETIKIKTQQPKIYRRQQSCSKKEVYSDRSLSLESKKISDNLILYLKEVKEEQAKPKVSRRKEIIKIRPEINEIET